MLTAYKKKMIYKAAFASNDGKVVNQHFGHAERFVIIRIDEAKRTWKYIETREIGPACNHGEHSVTALDSVCSLLKDCRTVFVVKIGQGAQNGLARFGIRGIEAPYVIEDIIDTLLHRERRGDVNDVAAAKVRGSYSR
jgi:predicted Fe-Mo cluster-binding NifX family protein